jgi:hypothetical protein
MISQFNPINILTPKLEAQWVALQHNIREISGLNIGPETDCTETLYYFMEILGRYR